jgi:hypothetical protein
VMAWTLPIDAAAAREALLRIKSLRLLFITWQVYV